jgi:hypothetical protein
MKYVIGAIVLGIAIYYFGIRGSDVERLLMPVTAAPESIVQDSHVEFDQRSLPLNDTTYLEAGQYTIIYYHWAQCPACRQLDSQLPPFLNLRKDVVVRRIQLANNWSTRGALRDFNRNIGATPFILIFNPEGKLVAADEGTGRNGSDLLYKWMNAELEKQWKAQHNT